MSALAGNPTALVAAPRARRGKSTAVWLVQRLAGAIAVIWAVATITFIMQAVTQTNRARTIYLQTSGTTSAPSKQALVGVSHEFGFDHSVVHQYLVYIGGIAHGDLGTSYFQHAAVTKVIGDQLGPTLILSGLSLVLAWIIALTVTALTAGRKNVWSPIGTGFQIISASLPSYWVGTILMVVFGLELKIFPVESGSSLIGLVLPTVTLGLFVSGFLGQVIYEEFSSVLEQPFVTSSRSRGMSDLGVRVRHVTRHAILPALTLSGLAIGYLFSGAVLVETVFARPGIGSVLVTATNRGDVPVVAGVVLTSAVIYIVANFVIDVLYRVVDPRIKST
jgi:peptide/nickel transport system permease protein